MPPGDASRIAQRRRAAQAEGAADYAARRLELVRTAALVFREKGYTSATLNDIAEKFGIDRASLYYYVGSKEELFQECVQGVLDENLDRSREIAAMDIGPRAKIEKLVEVVLASYEANYPYMFVYIQEDMSQVTSQESEWATKMVAQTKRLQKLFLDVLKDGVANGSFRADLPVGVVANGLFGMMNWTHRWYVPSTKIKASELARTFTSTFFDGFSTDRG
jgi:AcrR family transcriptional regulator